MYLENNDKYLCSGCTACMSVCPVNAIEMVRDSEGFKYPVINKEKCIDCKKCIKVCPNIKKSSENEILEAFEEHFNAGLAEGQSEEEIMTTLGTVEEVLQNIREMEET